MVFFGGAGGALFLIVFQDTFHAYSAADVTSPAAPDGKAAFPADIVVALTAQTMVPVSEGLSCVQAIMKINDKVQAYSDWRKQGHAALF